MKVNLLLSCALLSTVVGVYGSGTEMPGQNEVGPGGRVFESVNTSVSREVICSNEHLHAHPNPQVRALGDLVESVVYEDDSRSAIVRINISKELQRDTIYKLWGALSVIINKPEEVGFRCRLGPGFLQIEVIHLRNIDPNLPERPAPQTEIMDYAPLSQILKLATVNRLGVTVQSNDALNQLIYLLRNHGSLRELSINNISSQELFGQLGTVFNRHRSLEKVRLASIPELSIAEQERQSRGGGVHLRKMGFYVPYVDWFRALPHLNRLDLSEISVSVDVRGQIISLTNTLPNLSRENIRF